MTDNTNPQEVNEALSALRKAHEEGNQAVIKKTNDFLDKQEAKNQELVTSIKKNEAAQEELENTIKSLEAELKAPNISGDSKKAKQEEFKAFESFVCKGKNDLSDLERKYLRTDINDQGGYLVPITQESEMIKKITEISAIRSVAKVRTMPSKLMRMPVRSALIASSWVGEGQTNAISQSVYGREELVAKKLSVTAVISSEELQDASVNMISEINFDVAEEFGRAEGSEFVNGAGVNTPEGFMVNSNVPEINSGLAGAIQFDNFASLAGELKTGYRPIYGFNRKTLAAIRNLKDGSGAYIWRSGNLGAGLPNSIAGTSYIEIPDMANIGANAYPVIYGDFNMGYLIGDRLGFTVIRDDITLAQEDKVKFTFKKRLDGQVVLPEAFVKLKVSV